MITYEKKEKSKEEIKKGLRCIADLVNILIKIMMFAYFGYLFFTGVLGILSKGEIFQNISIMRFFFYFLCIASTTYDICLKTK